MSQVNQTQTSPAKKHNLLLPILIVGGILICLIVLVIIGGIYLWQRGQARQESGTSLDWGGALALVYNLDRGDEKLSAYIYNLEESDIVLPAGRYYAEMKLSDGTLMSFAPLLILDEGEGFGTADFKSRVPNSIQSPEIAQEMEHLVRFLIAVDNVRLTYFKISSNGFQNELFAANMEQSWSDEEQLMGALDKLGDSQEVIAAAQAFVVRAEASRADQPGRAGLCAPVSGIIDAIASFFSLSSEEDERARQEVLTMYAAINEPWEKEEAFEALDERQRAGATNFDEFIQKVENGEIQDMTRVRRDLMQQGPMAGIMQDLNPESNRPSGEIIHRVGGEAIKRGAELNVEVTKEVLDIVFPGMDEGFEYADKVNEWAEYIHHFYTDPLGALGDELKGQATDLISDQIKTQFQNLFPDMDQADIDLIVGQITDQATESITTMIALEPEIDLITTDPEVFPSETEMLEEEEVPTMASTEIMPETGQEPTEEDSASESGPSAPNVEIDLPDDLAAQESDENKENNENFVWDGTRACWNYIGPVIENSFWDCENQCFSYQDEDWLYDCTSTNQCLIYIGDQSDYWAWDCDAWCWEYLDPNYNYNCATQCFEYIGPDSHLWYYDCSRSCLDYIGPPIDGYTWSCEQYRWLTDD